MFQLLTSGTRGTNSAVNSAVRPLELRSSAKYDAKHDANKEAEESASSSTAWLGSIALLAPTRVACRLKIECSHAHELWSESSFLLYSVLSWSQKYRRMCVMKTFRCNVKRMLSQHFVLFSQLFSNPKNKSNKNRLTPRYL